MQLRLKPSTLPVHPLTILYAQPFVLSLIILLLSHMPNPSFPPTPPSYCSICPTLRSILHHPLTVPYSQPFVPSLTIASPFQNDSSCPRLNRLTSPWMQTFLSSYHLSAPFPPNLCHSPECFKSPPNLTWGAAQVTLVRCVTLDRWSCSQSQSGCNSHSHSHGLPG